MRRRLGVICCAVLTTAVLPHGQSFSSSGPVTDHSHTSDSLTVTTSQLDPNPQGWFVELSSPPSAEGASTAALDREEASFHAAARAAGVRYRETRHFRILWNGLVIQTDASAASRLLSVPGVHAIYPVTNAVRAQQDEVPASVGNLATALTMTGADIAQSQLGLTGRGVRVAVIDSGIDYDHPDLGGCFGPACRVVIGYDLVGNDFNPDATSPTYSPTPRPDPDPDDCDGHGTHVAGIIGASGRLTGVAPGVTLSAYRVFGCEGPTTTDVMLAAMERVLLDGADVVNMSIGLPLQWPQYPTAQAADRLVRLGIKVVASAGNDANLGLYASSAPGAGRHVFSVASFDNTHANVAAFAVSPDQRLVGYSQATAAPPAPLLGVFPLARTGTVTTENDACEALPAGSLSGRVALIRRGTCGFTTKIANAQAAGARGVVLYNNVPGRLNVTVAGGSPVLVPVVSITPEDGALINARLATGAVVMTWTGSSISERQPTGGLVSSFSSWGPTPDLSLKPDLGAPGGPVRSTVPLEIGGYGAIGGTSQAAPHVAGALALLLESNPGLSSAALLTRLQNTASPSVWAGNPALGYLDSAHRQGAGLVAIDRAIQADRVVMPGRLALGEFASGPQVRTLTLSRLGRAARCQDRSRHRGKGPRPDTVECAQVTYRLGHTPGLATGANPFSPVLYAGFATVEFDRETLAIDDDKRRDTAHDRTRKNDRAWPDDQTWDTDDDQRSEERVLVRITPPSSPEVRLFGGYITLTPNDGSAVLRVPYVGYNGDYQAIAALTPTPFGFPWLARLNGTTLTNQPNGATFTMRGTDVPFILYHLDHQVRRITMQVVDVATGRSFDFADRRDYLGRNSAPTSFSAFVWDGTTAPARGDLPPTRVPNGTYRLEVSVLKALGDRRSPTHTERWTSPNITIARLVP